MAWGLSHKYKFIFVHVPKTAGTTICSNWDGAVLKNICRDTGVLCDDSDHHLTALQLRDKFPKEWSEYHKFAVVRNPYDRFVSKFFFRGMALRQAMPISWSDKEMEGMFPQLHFIAERTGNIFPQYGKVLVNSVLRYENLQHDLMGLFDFLGIKIGFNVFPHFRKTDQAGIYGKYFTPEFKCLVDYIYREDIKRWRYSYSDRDRNRE